MKSGISVGFILVGSLLATTARAQSPNPDAPHEVPAQPTGTTPAEPPAPGTGPDDSALAKDGHPLAGWHNGLFYLRDVNDNFRLHIQGRAQVDFYSYFGSGVSDTALKPTLFLRRVRPEVTGEFFHRLTFMLAGDFGATALDNPKGTNETSAAAPSSAPGATTGRYASAQTARISAAPTDVFIDAKILPELHVQLGQFDANFTMENRTSDKYIPFMERSLAVRAVGIPTNKEIGLMLWGELPSKYWFYSVGLFDGDGQNRLDTDANGELMVRTFVHPLASMPGELKDLQIGGSLLYGSRDKKFTFYDVPNLTTQGNYAFWTSAYNGANGQTHVLESGTQLGLAGELRIPVSRFDLTGELVYVNNETREAIEGFQASNSERFGAMKGISYYAMLGFWAMGKRDINGMPGYENPSHVDFAKADPVDPPHALQFLVKWEQVSLKYDSASRGGVADAKNIDGDIKANAFSLGANYWYTKHFRFSLNYVLNMFPDSAPTSASATGGPVWTSSQRALAPGNGLAKTVNDSARDSAHSLHEVLFRAAVAL